MATPKKKAQLKFDDKWFSACVKNDFDFLVSDYRFAAHDLEWISYEANIKYVKSTVAINIQWVHGGLPEIRLCIHRQAQWIGYTLDDLSGTDVSSQYGRLPRRCDPESQKYADVVIDWLGIHARLLKTYGQEFLNGDPSRLEKSHKK